MARTVAQRLSAFKKDGGMERATQKMEEMVKNGLLIADDQKAKNGVMTRVYSLTGTTYAANGYAISGGIDDGKEDGVASTENGVADDFDANINGNKGLGNGVGSVADFWECENEKDFADYFRDVAASPKEDIEDEDCEVPFLPMTEPVSDTGGKDATPIPTAANVWAFGRIDAAELMKGEPDENHEHHFLEAAGLLEKDSEGVEEDEDVSEDYARNCVIPF